MNEDSERIWNELVHRARDDIRLFEDLINPAYDLGEGLYADYGITLPEHLIEELRYKRDHGWPVNRSELSPEQAQEAAGDHKQAAGISLMAMRGRWKR